MACFYHCDGCQTQVQAIRKKFYQLVPNGWYVGADTPQINSRSVELYACSPNCIEAATLKAPEPLRIYLGWRQVTRNEVEGCALCRDIGQMKCYKHSPLRRDNGKQAAAAV